MNIVTNHKFVAIFLLYNDYRNQMVNGRGLLISLLIDFKIK